MFFSDLGEFEIMIGGGGYGVPMPFIGSSCELRLTPRQRQIAFTWVTQEATSAI